MLTIRPQFIADNREKISVVLSVKEFRALMEEVEETGHQSS